MTVSEKNTIRKVLNLPKKSNILERTLVEGIKHLRDKKLHRKLTKGEKNLVKYCERILSNTK